MRELASLKTRLLNLTRSNLGESEFLVTIVWIAITRTERKNMSQNHYTTKTKRRQKNKKRKDPSAATMAKIRKLETAEKK